VPQDGDEQQARDAMRRLKAAGRLTVTSAAGTDLTVALAGARVGGVWGFTTKPGTLTHWPGGLVLAFPAAGSVSGKLVLDRGDVNLTFKRYLADPVTLHIADDHVERIEGDSPDAELMRGYFAAWGDRAAYATSHVGWGLNRRARWDAMAFYDKADFNGTELRAFAGNFLYSTGANEVAGRHTLGHFDLPLRGCTIALDDDPVVKEGVLL
jgi:2,5-dihydroxypyridine 5,6-dioxygenase